MIEYLEQVIHQNIDEYPYQNKDKLPLACRNAFELNVIGVGQQEFLLAAPIEDMNLTELRKMRLRLEKHTGLMCAYYLKKVNWYAAPRMIEEGIPFVWENQQVYLPFMGLLLQEKGKRTLKKCAQISFLTQKLLLKALYENWQDVSAVKAAEMLDVSRMSITRCYDEIEALGMPFIKTQGRSRRFHAMDDKKRMWEIMRPMLRNPVIRDFRLERKPDIDMIFSGISALAEYSMLGEDECIHYAVSKNQVRSSGLKDMKEVPISEEPGCIVHELGYILPFGNNTAVDPLSAELMLTDEELSDPRVEISLKEMLEEAVW